VATAPKEKTYMRVQDQFLRESNGYGSDRYGGSRDDYGADRVGDDRVIIDDPDYAHYELKKRFQKNWTPVGPTPKFG
jgi:hypothetical protein